MGYVSYLINHLLLKLFPTILIFLLSLITVFDFPCLLYADNSKNIQGFDRLWQ